MARLITLIAAFTCLTGVVHSLPAINSTTLRQNALEAQILNSEFLQVQVTDACNSGRVACINSTMATCKFGSWQTTDCGNSKECIAVPSTSSPGTNLICTSQASAMSMFQAAGLEGLFSNGTDTVAFPTMTPPSSVPAVTSSPTSSPPTSPSSSSDVDVVTVTVTVPVVSISTDLPTETRTINPAEAASILASISAQGLIATTSSPTPDSAASSTHVGHCQQTSSTPSVPPSITNFPEPTGFTRRGQVAHQS